MFIFRIALTRALTRDEGVVEDNDLVVDEDEERLGAAMDLLIPGRGRARLWEVGRYADGEDFAMGR